MTIVEKHAECHKIGAPPCWCWPPKIGDPGVHATLGPDAEQLKMHGFLREFMEGQLEQLSLLERIAGATETLLEAFTKAQSGYHPLGTYEASPRKGKRDTEPEIGRRRSEP